MTQDAESLYFELMHKIAMTGEPPACASDPEMFFHDTTLGGQTNAMLSANTMRERIAKAICNECPLKRQCAEYAIIGQEEYGIWGGTTPTERRAIYPSITNRLAR